MLHRRILRIGLVLSIAGVLSSCQIWRPNTFTGPPDKILFDRATVAAEDGKLDVARLTLQTLVNTYPDSEYAEKAKDRLRDPQLYGCGSNCDEQFGGFHP